MYNWLKRIVVILLVIFFISKQFNYIGNGSTQTLAILDTGINNQLLNKYHNQIIDTYNVVEHSHDVKDKHGHGSSLTSLIVGFPGNRGIVPKVKIIIVKITDSEGNSSNQYLYEGLKYVENKADVVNISLGGNIADEKVINQIQQMIQNNIDIVAAAGDYGNKDLLFPANIDGVISVGSLDEQFNISEFSNYEDCITCLFPGEDIHCYDGIYSGTSYSSILASGYVLQIRDYMTKNNVSKNTIEVLKRINPYYTKSMNIKSNSAF